MMLTSIHWNVLRSLMNRIIPPDDFPDAWEAGVEDYLARQFERDLYMQVETYRLGLEALETESRAFADKSFTELDTSMQDTILARLETGQVIAAWTVNPTEFFHMVIENVMEGYYSDPGNGGNHDAISWKMIGFTGQRK
jgi:gluconate 2-dehydrogenase subunit 3-like protein